MSKKHFELLAKNISTIHNPEIRKVVTRLVADACAQSNSRFDQVRFYRACGVE